MKVTEAKQLALGLINDDLAKAKSQVLLDPASPDPKDDGKFLLDGKPARAIHHFDGWYIPINLNWFSGAFNPPVIHGGPFHWYVFAIPRRNKYRRDHYLVCDYLQVRDWVMDFAAPLGNDHRDHRNWRADLRIFTDDETTGYFRWGDEPPGSTQRAGRVFQLDNVSTILDASLTTDRVGIFGPGGESAAHHRLKLYVASHPTEFGLSSAAEAHVEYLFRTGDRVDVMFENHKPDRTVVEVEVEGEVNVCVGIHQAIKYRSLAAADGGYSLVGSQVRSLVVAYDTRYQRAIDLARQYDIDLASVDRHLVLASAV